MRANRPRIRHTQADSETAPAACEPAAPCPTIRSSARRRLPASPSARSNGGCTKWPRRRSSRTPGLYHPEGNFNYQDAWADCYPFLVWAAWLTDLEALNGPVRGALHAEIKHCPPGILHRSEEHLRRQRVCQGRSDRHRRGHRQGRMVRSDEGRPGRDLGEPHDRDAVRQDPFDEHRGQRRADSRPSPACTR